MEIQELAQVYGDVGLQVLQFKVFHWGPNATEQKTHTKQNQREENVAKMQLLLDDYHIIIPLGTMQYPWCSPFLGGSFPSIHIREFMKVISLFSFLLK